MTSDTTSSDDRIMLMIERERRAAPGMTSENPYPPDSWVKVRYPLTSEHERGDPSAWPWLPGWVVAVCGPDEWQICVQAPELATLEDDGETVYPVCLRDASEIRPAP